jgi:hypothetical protein
MVRDEVLDPHAYPLTFSREFQKKFGFNYENTMKRYKEQPTALFWQEHFHIPRGFTYHMTRREVEDLIQLSGGEVTAECDD